MLANLDKINWKKLTDAYGSARRIPKAIRLLKSIDPEDWVGALDELYARLCHQQCTVYEATAPAVPFLIELLQVPEIRCRGRILQLLGDIAGARSYLEAHGDFFNDAETEKFQQQLELEQKWAGQAHEAVWQGLDVYIALLGDFDPRLRISVPYTLGLLLNYAGGCIPDPIRRQKPHAKISKALARQLDEEPNELIRASLVFGLSTLVNEYPNNATRLRKLVNPRESPQVRVAAAMCLGEADPNLPDEVIQVLVDALTKYPETDNLFKNGSPGMEAKHHPLAKAYRQMGLPLSEDSGTGPDPDDVGADEDFRFPWLDGWPRFSYINRLCRLSSKHEKRILPALLIALRAENPYTVERVSAPILRYVFRGQKAPRGATSATLSPAQRKVLQLLYDNPLLWATDIGNVESVFSNAGLPESRKAWRRLLGIKKKPTTAKEAEGILERLVRVALHLADGTQIEDKHTKRMNELNLCQIGDDGFVPLLARFSKLAKLNISSGDLSDNGLAAFPDLPRLQELILCATAVTDRGLAHLTRFKTLKRLNLYRTRITDTGLKQLDVLKNLRSLFIVGTKVSEKAIKQLKTTLPRCKIEWKP